MSDDPEISGNGSGEFSEEAVKSRLPIRVRGGEIDGEYLVLYTAVDKKRIAWLDVKIICLGIIKEVVGDFEPPKSMLRNLVRGVMYGEKESDRQVPKTIRNVYLVDIYVGESEIPYRIDSTLFDYRNLLEKLDFISINNFRKMFEKLAKSATTSRFDKNSAAFLCMRTYDLRKVGSVYDFDLESLEARRNLEKHIPQCDLQFKSPFMEETKEENESETQDGAGEKKDDKKDN
ncbi:MAG: hypothetical protein M1269_04085 [Chloroflexi bacterium]|nr:hypothetical protein [Chloroflexota bacterium]